MRGMDEGRRKEEKNGRRRKMEEKNGRREEWMKEENDVKLERGKKIEKEGEERGFSPFSLSLYLHSFLPLFFEFQNSDEGKMMKGKNVNIQGVHLFFHSVILSVLPTLCCIGFLSLSSTLSLTLYVTCLSSSPSKKIFKWKWKDSKLKKVKNQKIQLNIWTKKLFIIQKSGRKICQKRCLSKNWFPSKQKTNVPTNINKSAPDEIYEYIYIRTSLSWLLSISQTNLSKIFPFQKSFKIVAFQKNLKISKNVSLSKNRTKFFLVKNVAKNEPKNGTPHILFAL